MAARSSVSGGRPSRRRAVAVQGTHSQSKAQVCWESDLIMAWFANSVGRLGGAGDCLLGRAGLGLSGIVGRVAGDGKGQMSRQQRYHCPSQHSTPPTTSPSDTPNCGFLHRRGRRRLRISPIGDARNLQNRATHPNFTDHVDTQRLSIYNLVCVSE